MFSHPLVLCVVCALGFGFWPVARGMFLMPINWALVILSVIALIAVLLPFRPADIPPMRAMVWFTLLGAILNGVALLMYGGLLSQKGDVVTKWVPVMATMMPIVALIGGALLLNEPITARKACGIVVACFSIYLMCT